jgi:hypothetical protein
MDYILEIFKNTVAFLILMRIAVVAGLVLIVVRFAYSHMHSQNQRKMRSNRKKQVSRYIDLLKHSR